METSNREDKIGKVGNGKIIGGGGQEEETPKK